MDGLSHERVAFLYLSSFRGVELVGETGVTYRFVILRNTKNIRKSKSTYIVMIVVAILLLIKITHGEECFDDGNEFCINQNDILSVDLLPGSFLFAGQQKTANLSKLMDNETVDGSFDKALNEMDYHRKRMNEYLCHGYMAEEIFKEVSTPRVKRRPESARMNHFHDFLGNDNVTIHDKLLADEGSAKYKDWLQRTTTLDDIYRHYAPRKKLKRKQGLNQENLEEFDGEVTGYAMQAPLPSGKIGVYEPPGDENDHMVSSSSGHNFHYGSPFAHEHFSHHHGEFYPAIHEEYYYTAPYHHDHHDHHEHHEHQEEDHRPYYKGKGHDLSIRDFFEIALTALAFLTFGLFIIQLLMNATNANAATTATMMADGTRRFKRSTTGSLLSYSSNEELNELSHRVLRSIEAALVAEEDSGNCLRRILCEDNRYSRETEDGRRIWTPVWSLGMSWISGRVLYRTSWSAMLDSVKASILGLGGADCGLLYPDCNLRKERMKRRRRRRR